MLISRDVYMVIIFIILACAFLPFFYYLIKERKKKIWSLFILIILLPLDIYTPAVTTVTACGEYKKEVLLFSTNRLESGNHGYIINQSNQPIYLETIVYSEETDTMPEIDQSEVEFAIIQPNDIYRTHFGHAPQYIFEEADESIHVKGGSSKLRYRLSCEPFDMELMPETHYDGDDIYHGDDETGTESIRIDRLDESH